MKITKFRSRFLKESEINDDFGDSSHGFHRSNLEAGLVEIEAMREIEDQTDELWVDDHDEQGFEENNIKEIDDIEGIYELDQPLESPKQFMIGELLDQDYHQNKVKEESFDDFDI